jgi:hypothetical protein
MLNKDLRPKDYHDEQILDEAYHLSFLAARMGLPKVLRELMVTYDAQGYDWYLDVDGEEHSTLCAAIWSGNADCLDILLQDMRRDYEDEDEDEDMLFHLCCPTCGPALAEVCEQGSVAQLRLLVEGYGADLTRPMEWPTYGWSTRLENEETAAGKTPEGGTVSLLPQHSAVDLTKSFPLLKFILDEACSDLDPNAPVEGAEMYDGYTVLFLRV